ncbi:DNA cytosine methyltransferase [Sphingomonas sp. UV9]|uniref:DNA cytosine methyltransferase n=1 Tax=Sphingomonas sp. UV9 TaxID=1851410 RepID=UPI000FFBBB14|nr:DNA cytosine methyltransferase [Sphingomonas sp. UV9]RXD02524.1 DNA cytosine methyltransferase [Sphingomonas sp. UV9]
MDKVVSLFSGAGGLSLGFKNGGVQPDFAADMNVDACQTYAANLNHPSHVLDLGSEDSTAIKKLLLPFKNCLAVIGGPPCQGFSTAGRRNSNDPRNRLVFNYLQIVDYLNPRWFIFENVEGLLTSGDGESLQSLLDAFITRGYAVRVEKINFASYGLPQSRKRVLIMGNRVGAHFHFPAQTHSYVSGKHNNRSLLPYGPSINDAILDLPEPGRLDERLSHTQQTQNAYAEQMRAGSVAVTHHFTKISQADATKFALLSAGQTMRDLPESEWHASYRLRAFRRVADGTPTERRGGAPAGIRKLVGENASPTITGAASREFIHPTAPRPLTIRETARLQSFPDAFQFIGTARSKSVQIGNAIPPLAAEVLARTLVRLDGQAGADTGNYWTTPGLLGYHLTDASGQSPALQKTETRLKALPSATITRSKQYG